MASRPLLPRHRDQLARQLMPLVHDVAGQVARRLPAHVAREDLAAAGMEGLAAALARYDHDRADTFRSYAEFRIRGAIMDDLRRRDMVSRKARRKMKRIDQAKEVLGRELGRSPTDDEVAIRVDMTLQHLRDVQTRQRSAATIPADSVDIAADQNTPSMEVATREAHEHLYKAMRSVPERTRRVLHLYYFDELTLREIADRLQISLSRVCQIRKDAERRLRRRVPPLHGHTPPRRVVNG